MAIVFWILLVVYLAAALAANIRHFNPLSPHFLLPIGFFLPCIAYFCSLSELIEMERCFDFYLVLIEFLIVLLFDVLYWGQDSAKIATGKITIKCPPFVVDLLNLFYIGMYFLENLIASGSLLPSLVGVDIHTASVTGVAIVTRALFVFVIIDYLAYKATGSRRFLLWAVWIILEPALIRSARMNTSICVLQLVAWFWMSRIPCKEKRNTPSESHVLRWCLIGVVMIALAAAGALMTNKRMSNEAGKDLSFYEVSRLSVSTGSSAIDEIVAFFYGYTAFSFDNLNNAIKELPSTVHNYYGKYSFRPLTCGVLRLHNIMGFEPYEPGAFSAMISRECHDGEGFATVPTMLFEFYYDFWRLAFVPMLVGLLLWHLINSRRTSTRSLQWRILFAYYSPLFAFSAFQNLVFQGNMILELAMLFPLTKIIFKESQDEGAGSTVCI